MVSAKIEKCDVQEAIRVAISEDTLASSDDAIFSALRQLHPPRDAMLVNLAQFTAAENSPNESTSTLMLSVNDIDDAIKTVTA